MASGESFSIETDMLAARDIVEVDARADGK
jgi:hypothetical protein